MVLVRLFFFFLNYLFLACIFLIEGNRYLQKSSDVVTELERLVIGELVVEVTSM